MRQRVNQRLIELGLNASEAARRGGLERSFVKDLLLGKKKSVRGVGLLRLAYALNVSPAWLTGHSEEVGVPPDISELPPEHGAETKDASAEQKAIPEYVEIAGIAEADVFRPLDLLGPPPSFEHRICRLPEYPDARQCVYVQRGDGMDAIGIDDGMAVLAVDFECYAEQRGGLTDGMVVVVRRARADVDEVEISVRQVHYDAGRIELLCRSSNPRHRAVSFGDPLVEILAVAVVCFRFLV